MTFPTDPKNLSKNFNALSTVKEHWGWFLGLGILFIILGSMAIAASTTATLLSVIFLGALLLTGGVAQLCYTFSVRDWSGFFLSLASGILYSVVGFLMVFHPTASALSLTLVIAAFYIVGGFFRLFSAATLRFEHWGWLVLSGLIKVALGMLIWLGWPDTGLWVIGVFLGIDLIFYGWFWVLISLTSRDVKKTL
jgi:uncharacterized membrane protein HdeD (DUF308 family)